MTEIYFSVRDMSILLGIGEGAVCTRIRNLGVKESYKENNQRFYSQSDYEIIANNKHEDDGIIKYQAFRIESVYHIYPSKMNYLTDL